MKKLEDIPKKNQFQAPEGYFDTLPLRIQARIDQPKKAEQSFFFRYSLQYVVPAVVLVAVGVAWFSQSQKETSAESLLASIETVELISYLNDEDISTEQLVDEADFTDTDADDIENTVYELQFESESIDALLNEIDINTL
jgi:hypothetical protein